MNKSKLTIEIEKNDGRIFVCGDIHGNYDDFMRILEKIGFNFDEDLLLCTGDLVDRGPKSLDCFNLSYKSWFISCRGNHEQFCVDGFEDPNMKEQHINNGGAWFYSLPLDVQKVIVNTINNMPITITLNRKGKKYGFIHGNIPIHLHDWSELNDCINGASSDNYINNCIWGRSRIKQSIGCNWINHINNNITDVDEVFIGHTVINEHKKVGNINYIDTGFVFYDKLTIIEI